MRTPDGPSPSPRPSRRHLLRLSLAGVGALGLAGCGVEWSKVRVDTGRTPTPPQLSAEDLARFAAVDAVTAALTTARAAGDPGRTAVRMHEEHLRQLGPLPGPVPSGSPTPSAWPTTTPTATADLASAEEAAARTVLIGVEVLEPGLATLLTSVATSCAALAAASGKAVEPPVPDVRGRLDEETDEDEVAGVVRLIEADRLAGYAFGPLAAALTQGARDRAVAALHRHSDRALANQKLLADAGFSVPPSPPGYRVPVPTDEQAAATQAAQLEAACAQAAAPLVRSGVRPLNLAGIQALVDAGLAQASWREPVAFPGLPELA